MLWHSVLSTGGFELALLNLSRGSIGVLHGLHPESPAFLMIFVRVSALTVDTV
jgi:hypothetical protein